MSFLMEQFEHQHCSVLYRLIKIPFILVEMLYVDSYGYCSQMSNVCLNQLKIVQYNFLNLIFQNGCLKLVHISNKTGKSYCRKFCKVLYLSVSMLLCVSCILLYFYGIGDIQVLPYVSEDMIFIVENLWCDIIQTSLRQKACCSLPGLSEKDNVIITFFAPAESLSRTEVNVDKISRLTF